MKNCRKTIKLLSPYLDRELDALKMKLVDDHLGHCRACQERIDDMKATSLSIRSLTPIKTPPRYEDVVLAKIRLSGDEQFVPTLGQFFTPFRMKVAFSFCASLFLIFIVSIAVHYSPPTQKSSTTLDSAAVKKSLTDDSRPEYLLTDHGNLVSTKPQKMLGQRFRQWPQPGLNARSVEKKLGRNPFYLIKIHHQLPLNEEDILEGELLLEDLIRLNNHILSQNEDGQLTCPPCFKKLEPMTFYPTVKRKKDNFKSSPAWQQNGNLLFTQYKD
ncbi:anti-sigma factor family protein [candidate division CSSED10-310 bacterium]|uniref:Anti-sigma factor family protein n=1 Tax=candidate division CSSED10-310 bacterium TaxID=2855610 RepID=A0ABV6YU36_UNCC1